MGKIFLRHNCLKFKAFSLIELLITLIILSLVLSAFIPLITKKLKASDITVGSFGNNSTSGGGVSIQRNVTKEDCINLNAIYVPAGVNVPKPLCVMKYNIGDVGIEDWTGVQKCETGKDCTVENSTLEATASNLQATCWQGTTANPCDNNYGNYSGCTRTVCNWTGANRMCENIGWRLPTFAELKSFTNSTYSNSTLLSAGLMLCGGTDNSAQYTVCQWTSGCKGSLNGNCHSTHYWSSSFSTETKIEFRRLLDGWEDTIDFLAYPHSARCVLDTINETVEAPKQETKCNCDNGICENNKTYCTKCNTGFKLADNVCIKEGTEIDCDDYFCASCSDKTDGTCLTCKQGYTLHEGKCYFGTLEGCNNPNYDDTYHRIICGSCQDDYTKCNSGSCRLTSALSAECPINMKKIGCTCVTKYNIGDGYYEENLNIVTKCIAGADCTVQNGSSTSATARNIEAACWTGKEGENTAGAGCNNTFGGDYEGCKRTVCNWLGGQKMCESKQMRLPTMPELIAFTNNTYSSSSALTTDGGSLMLCGYSNSTISPVCPGLVSGCLGTYAGHCYPYYIWSSSFRSSTEVWNRYHDTNWCSSSGYLGLGLSIRCVKDL